MTNGPKVFGEILDGLHSYLRRKQIARIEEIVGKADAARTYDEIGARDGARVPWEK